MSFGVVITKSVAIVGVLLVFSYLVVPAVIAQMWAESVRGRLLFGWVVAILASTLGIVWSFYSDYPTGPAVVVMLALFLVVSGTVYYVLHAPVKSRAVATVAAIALFGTVFFGTLERLRKVEARTAVASLSPVDMLLEELKQDEEVHQLDGVTHLGDMKDARIVPALTALLTRTKSDQVVEAAIVALGKQRDPRAIPALREAAVRLDDVFLKLTVARTQLSLGDIEGFGTLILLLKNSEAGYARVQAYELLESKAGRGFGYDPGKPVEDNEGSLRQIHEWYSKTAPTLSFDPKTTTFR
jgi:hypothetical protein